MANQISCGYGQHRPPPTTDNFPTAFWVILTEPGSQRLSSPSHGQLGRALTHPLAIQRFAYFPDGIRNVRVNPAGKAVRNVLTMRLVSHHLKCKGVIPEEVNQVLYDLLTSVDLLSVRMKRVRQAPRF